MNFFYTLVDEVFKKSFFLKKYCRQIFFFTYNIQWYNTDVQLQKNHPVVQDAGDHTDVDPKSHPRDAHPRDAEDHTDADPKPHPRDAHPRDAEDHQDVDPDVHQRDVVPKEDRTVAEREEEDLTR